MSAPFRGLWAVLATVIATVAVLSPVSAHTDLLSSDPADGQTLSSAPERITLRFGEEMLDGGATIVAKSSGDERVDLGPTQVDGTRLTASWPQAAAEGTFTVAWRAVASDGHPLEGRFTFEIRAEGTSVSAEPSPAQAVPSASPVTAVDDQQGGQGVNLVLPALFVLAVAAVGFFVWRSRAD